YSGLCSLPQWNCTLCCPCRTRTHACGVSPTGRPSTYTLANGTALTLTQPRLTLGCCASTTDGVLAPGADDGVSTGARGVLRGSSRTAITRSTSGLEKMPATMATRIAAAASTTVRPRTYDASVPTPAVAR